MAIGDFGHSNVPRKDSRVEKYTEEDNVKDIKDNLSYLKNEIQNKNPDKTVGDDFEMSIYGNEQVTSRNGLAKLMDDAAEEIFDDYFVKHYENEVKALLLADDHVGLENLFHEKVRKKIEQEHEVLKNMLESFNIMGLKFELSPLKQEIINMINAEGRGDSGTGGSDNPFTGPGETTSPEGYGPYARESVEGYINPTTLNSTSIGTYRYYDFYEKGDGKVSNRDLKKAGIVNRYRNNNNDKNIAVLGILNNINEKDFEKKHIRSINWDDLVHILDDVLDDKFLDNVKDSDGKIDKKEFRRRFKEKFKDEYKKKGLFNFGEINKIADIVSQAIEQEHDDDRPIRDALQRLADAGSAAKNMDYTGMYNAQVLISKIDSDDIFLFLCDFDGDGVVNSTDGGKDKKNKGRRDVGSVMGGQLYTNFLQYADTEFEKDGDDKFNNNKVDKLIVNGPNTSRVIQNILEAVVNFTDNNGTKKAINQFIQDNTTTDGTTTITMEDFHSFMKDGYAYEYEEIKDGKPITKKQKVSGLSDIKEFLMAIGNQLNEQKDVSRLFLDKSSIQQQILQSAAIMTDMKNIELDKNNPFVQGLHDGYEKEIRSIISDSDLQIQQTETELDHLRNSGVYNTIKVINYLTDLIYLDFGNTADTIIGGIFNGATIGGIKYTFNNKDNTLNGRKVKDVLGNYVAERVEYSVGVGIGVTGPVLGGSIKWKKYNDDLSNKFEARISGNIHPAKLEFNFNFGVEWAWQINKSKTKDLKNKKPIPVNRIGIETGAGIDPKRLQISAFLGVFFERDFPAGIEQQARHYDRMIKQVLNYDNIQIYSSFAAYETGMANNLTRLIHANNDQVEDFKQNQKFLTDMYTMIGKELQWLGVFELINSLQSEELKKNIFEYMYTGSIDAFHENAIEQNGYEQLAGQLKLTRLGLRGKLVDILSFMGLGAALGSVVPGRGTITGAVTGTIIGMATFSTWKVSYTEDVMNKGGYIDMQRGNTAQNHQELLDEKNIENLALFIKKQVNPNEELVQVSSKDDKLVITGIKGTNPLDYLNVYYSEKALENELFSFQNNVLTIGNVGFRIARKIFGNKVETILFIGEEFIDEDDQDKEMGGDMTKLSKHSITENKAESVKAFEEVDYFGEFDKNALNTFVNSDTNLKSKSTEILSFFDDTGTFKNNHDKIPASLRGTQLTVGTLLITEDPNGNVSVTSYTSNTPSDQLKIRYVVQNNIDNTTTTQINTVTYQEQLNINTGNIFQSDSRFNVFTKDVERTMSTFENAYKTTLYKDFMLPVLDVARSGFIDEQNYEQAFLKLKEILENNTTYKNAIENSPLGQVKTLINGSLTNNDITFIVDKFKAIFSYDREYTKGAHIPWYRDGYTKLHGPDNSTPYPLTQEYKKDLQKNIGQSNTLQAQTVNNLVGFTAFYRLQEDAGRRFSMTAVGGTNVLSDGNLNQSMVAIDKKNKDLQKTQDRFINNLKTNTANQDILLKKLNNQLATTGVVLEPKHIDGLFRGDNVTIDNGKKIVKLDVNYRFYLLAECANESIGATIDNITVYDKVEGVYTETIIDGSTSGISKTKRGVSLQTQTTNAEYDANLTPEELTIGSVFTINQRTATPEVTVGGGKDPGGFTPVSGNSQDPGNGTPGGGGQ